MLGVVASSEERRAPSIDLPDPIDREHLSGAMQD
jgi:hypothetical protein